jgi:hypothetical protein
MSGIFSQVYREVHFHPRVVGSIPTAPTKALHLQRIVEAFGTNKALGTN